MEVSGRIRRLKKFSKIFSTSDFSNLQKDDEDEMEESVDLRKNLRRKRNRYVY